MKRTDNQTLKEKYNSLFIKKLNQIIEVRKELGINQVEMASWCGKTLRTIQNFENNRTKDAYIMYAYQEKFKRHGRIHIWRKPI